MYVLFEFKHTEFLTSYGVICYKTHFKFLVSAFQ